MKLNKTKKTCTFALLFIINQLGVSLLLGGLKVIQALPIALQSILLSLAGFIPIMIFYFIFTKEAPKHTLRLRHLGFRDAFMCVVLGLAIQPAMSLLSLISSLFSTNNVSGFLDGINQSPVFISIVSIAFMPAVFEELFFRGIIFSGFKNISLKKALLLSGFIFGVVHFDIQQFPYAFAMGVIFAYIVYKTGSIFASMITHFTINGSQLLLARIMFQSMSTQEVAQAAALPATQADFVNTLIIALGSTVISLPLVILTLWVIGRKETLGEPVVFDEDSMIMTEDVLDYRPLPGCEEKIFSLPFWVIVIFFLLITFSFALI